MIIPILIESRGKRQFNFTIFLDSRMAFKKCQFCNIITTNDDFSKKYCKVKYECVYCKKMGYWKLSPCDNVWCNDCTTKYN